MRTTVTLDPDTDAHLAAPALEHGATIVSFDRDFGRFEGVRWRPPQAVGP